MTLKKLAVLLVGVCISASAYAQQKNFVKGAIEAVSSKTPTLLAPQVERTVFSQVAATKAPLAVKSGPNYAYLPQNANLFEVQKYMQKNNNHWPQIVPLVGNAIAARNLYLTIIKDHEGMLSPSDREQLYHLFLNNNIHSVQSIVTAYNRWKQAHSVDPRMPTEEELKMGLDNPHFSQWYPELFDDMKRYLALPWMWNTATMIYLGQKVYPDELPTELMGIDVFRQKP